MAKALNDIFETAEGEREDIWDEGKGDEKRDAAKIDIDAI